MSKILITGDVHIHDFRSHNLFDDSKFRLNQFIKLAHRIVDIAEDQNADTLVIAGDFLHVCSPRPYIVNTAFKFLDIVTKRMEVYLTHGQHDYDARASIEQENTLLTICERVPRVHYIHKDTVNIHDRKFYFLGWEPHWGEYVKSISRVDVLIGHTSPDNVSIGQFGYKMYGGVELPEDANYEIAFLGDIHYHQFRNRWVIPGTPIQHCLAGETEVFLADGTKRSLESLYKKKEKKLFVYSTEGKVPKISKGQEVKLTKHVSTLCHVKIGDKVIRCTPDHPFFLADGTYVAAENLVPGTSLMPLYKEFSDGHGLWGWNGYERVSTWDARWYLTHWLADEYNNPEERFPHGESLNTHRHHINGNKHDNRPDNIKRLSRGDHHRLHLEQIGEKTQFTSEKTSNWWKSLSTEQRQHISEERSKSAKEQWNDPFERGKLIEGIRLAWEKMEESTLIERSKKISKKNKTFWGNEERSGFLRKKLADVKRKEQIERHHSNPDWMKKAQVLKVVRDLMDIGLVRSSKDLSKEVFESQRKKGHVTWNYALAHLFSSPNEMFEEAIEYKNHTVYSVELVTYDKPQAVYDIIDVERYHNFAVALSDNSGVFVHNSFNDKPSVGIIALDTETLGWSHIPTIVPGSWEFLQMVITDESSDDPYMVTRRMSNTSSKEVRRHIEGSLETLSVIQTEVEKAGLKDLHETILGGVPKDIREEVLLNFSIDRIQIKNFRSISEFEWNNMGNGVNLLVGLNGTGKTALVSAIMFGLAGEGDARKSTRIGTKSMEVIIDVTYGGLRHTLRRGWGGGGKTQYLINGEAQDAENQKALKEKIEANLPFLRMMDLMCHRQDRPGFLASYNYAARVELISRVLGLKIVNELHRAAQAQTITIEQQLATLREKISSVTAVVEQESLVDFSVMEIIDDATEDDLQTLRSRIKDTLSSERRKYQRATSQKAALVDRLKRSTTDASEIERKRRRLGEFSCYTCGQTLNAEKHQALLEEITTEISKKWQEITELEAEIASCEDYSTELIKKLEERLSAVQTHLGEITAMKEQAESLKKLRIVIDNAKQELQNYEREILVVQAQKDALVEYRKLMEANGSVMRTLLTEVSSVLTTDSIRVRAYKTLVSGELRPDFGVDMDVKGRWVSYDELSGGQKTVCDLAILENLIRVAGGVGLLIFDETFHDLDLTNLEFAVDLVKSLQCRMTFIVSHTEGFPYYDSRLQATMDDAGKTTYLLR